MSVQDALPPQPVMPRRGPGPRAHLMQAPPPPPSSHAGQQAYVPGTLFPSATFIKELSYRVHARQAQKADEVCPQPMPWSGGRDMLWARWLGLLDFPLPGRVPIEPPSPDPPPRNNPSSGIWRAKQDLLYPVYLLSQQSRRYGVLLGHLASQARLPLPRLQTPTAGFNGSRPARVVYLQYR